ncbi:hypothetical protein C1646_682981, partial [Rhizophagus diaphanus]
PSHIVSAIIQVTKGQHSYKKRKRTSECLTYIKEKNYEASDEKRNQNKINPKLTYKKRRLWSNKTETTYKKKRI